MAFGNSSYFFVEDFGDGFLICMCADVDAPGASTCLLTSRSQCPSEVNTTRQPSGRNWHLMLGPRGHAQYRPSQGRLDAAPWRTAHAPPHLQRHRRMGCLARAMTGRSAHVHLHTCCLRPWRCPEAKPRSCQGPLMARSSECPSGPHPFTTR